MIPRVQRRSSYAVEIFLRQPYGPQGQQQIFATLDTGACSPWISQILYKKHARDPARELKGAMDADGRPLRVLGESEVIFILWGRSFKVTAKILPNLPRKFIVGRKFIISVG